MQITNMNTYAQKNTRLQKERDECSAEAAAVAAAIGCVELPYYGCNVAPVCCNCVQYGC